ncbi:MAG: proline dehydrogenase family protein [Caldilineaceae bacterium]|nr:proline dehydrogenase family protein [Caldilineaceae bacterium]
MTAKLSDENVQQWAAQAVDLAAQLLTTAQAQQTAAEKRQAAKIAGMMRDPRGKLMTMALSDQAFRSHDPARINDQIMHLIHDYGVPAYFADWEQVALELGTRIGQYIPHLVVPFVVARLRAETSSVILPGEEDDLRTYLQKRRSQHTRLNLNQLGEAILGEGEAQRRLESYIELLSRPDVEYISVKISSVFSQINLVAFDATVAHIKERLRILYRAALQHHFVQPDGTQTPKFINLDMEEYRDLHLTIAAFQQVLDEPEFLPYSAGIVLQAYLPDSHAAQIKLTEWAKARVQRGGAPIKVRIVKGANLAMERVEAALHGWEQAPYYTKADVDANYKRMVLWGCQPQNAAAVHLGIASHNLFDVAFGLSVRDAMQVQPHVEFEMLEGMANHQARAVQAAAGGLLLYAPVVTRDDFHSAIAYLVRRLDENTAPENFLHDLFDLHVGNPTWERQKHFFMEAVAHRNQVATTPNRTQNRLTEQRPFAATAPFQNEPDTDFALPANQQWAKSIVEAWRDRIIDPIPLQIGGQRLLTNHNGMGRDPSRPHVDVRYRYAQAQPDQIDRALTVAVAAQEGWRNRSIGERKVLLLDVAEMLAARRADLIGAAMLDGGKTIPQADTEVSEAIDFANYYARAFDELGAAMESCQFEPLGTVLVTPPWNFPIAIPAGGMLAALMAGNTVLLKPAPETVLVAWELVNAFWDAGIPQDVLQFTPTTDDEVGQALVTDARVDAVILTGGYETARLFLSWKPELHLLAETSGKNSMIISGLADHDLAIKDLVYSAFGHNGQKCSAASLAVLEAEVYDNPTFLRQLKDAAASLPVGPAWELTSQITPLIRPPSGPLARAQSSLEPGESWLLEPHMVEGNPNLWTPGIKLGVKPGSFYHKTECFGPVLGLMRAADLDAALRFVNASEFGLTSGLHSLDDREVTRWRERIEVGNAYVNRATTGAIVRRQPFGGWKRSAFGSGAKAGGPNYVLSLGRWRDRADDLAAAEVLRRSRASYQQAWAEHFHQEHDPSQVLGESNILRYRPIRAMVVRAESTTPPHKLRQVEMAAAICGVPLSISLPVGQEIPAGLSGGATITTIVQESESELAQRVHTFERLRHLGAPTDELLTAAHAAHVPVIHEPVTTSGRLELRYYLREQAVSETRHRYGNVIKRDTE